MPHLRHRVVLSIIRDALSFSPLVGIIGQRQIGKTTLAEQLVSNYLTLDNSDALGAAQLTPATFLSQTTGLTAIDECQKAPELFPALKLLVQKNKRPGQFLLTGSVRFTSRKLITESLTGRLVSIEILPLTIAEIANKRLGDFTKWANWDNATLKRHFTERLSWFKEGDQGKFLRRGGLPGICFLRKDTHANGKFRSHIQTLLERDLRLVTQTTVSNSNVIALLSYISSGQSFPFVLKDAVRATTVSATTVKKLINAFEGLFLIRRILGDGYRRGEVFYMEDQGMATFLAPNQRASPGVRFAFSQLFAQAHYNYMNQYSVAYFESKGGAHVPLVFTVAGRKYGFIFNPGEKLTSHHIKTSESFQNHHPGSILFILSPIPTPLRISDSLLQVPLLGIG